MPSARGLCTVHVCNLYFLCELPGTDLLDTVMLNETLVVYILLALCVKFIILAKQIHLWKGHCFFVADTFC